MKNDRFFDYRKAGCLTSGLLWYQGDSRKMKPIDIREKRKNEKFQCGCIAVYSFAGKEAACQQHRYGVMAGRPLVLHI